MAEPTTKRGLAIERLRSLRLSLFHAIAGLSKGNPAVIRDQIDRWLDFYNSAKPGEPRDKL